LPLSEGGLAGGFPLFEGGLGTEGAVVGGTAVSGARPPLQARLTASIKAIKTTNIRYCFIITLSPFDIFARIPYKFIIWKVLWSWHQRAVMR
jgi:hypothetical protein